MNDLELSEKKGTSSQDEGKSSKSIISVDSPTDQQGELEDTHSTILSSSTNTPIANTPPPADPPHPHSPPTNAEMTKDAQKEKKSFVLEAYRAINQLELFQAKQYLQSARLIDMQDETVKSLYRNLVFWIDKIKEASSISHPVSKGDLILKFWHEYERKQKNYMKYASSDLLLSKEHYEMFKIMVVSLAHVCYRQALLNTPALKTDFDFRLKFYTNTKMLKNYQEAFTIIVGISNTYPMTPLLYCELADCYFLTHHIKNAKVIFREVFFLNAQEVLLENIETPFIHEIVKLIRAEQRYNEPSLKYWIPVYGYIYHHFNVIRDLTPIEFHNIQNNISNMEAKLEDHKALGNDNPQEILPTLLNSYFWLIEYYKKHNSESSNYQTQLKILYEDIKKVDPIIFGLLERNKIIAYTV